MKIGILKAAILTILLTFLGYSTCLAITVSDSSRSTSATTASQPRPIIEVTVIAADETMLTTREGELPLARDWKAYRRWGGKLTKESDLNAFAGRRVTLQLVNGEVKWVVLETKETGR